MWKAAFTGRSERSDSASAVGTSSRRRKSSSRGDSIASAPVTPATRRHGEGKSRAGSTYGNDERRSSVHGARSTYSTSSGSRTGALTASALRALRDEDDEDAWQDEDNDALSERKSRRGDGERRRKSKSEKRDRSRSRSRSRSREHQTEMRRKGRDSDRERSTRAPRLRGESRAEKETASGASRALPAVGSFDQFPGQYDANGFVSGPVQPFSHEHTMSGALPSATADSQFPGQNPQTYARPQVGPTRADSYGAAAEYYLDEGQSVNHQPGIRPISPNMLTNPDLENGFVAPSAEPAPVMDTGNGAAADFFSGKVSPVTFQAEAADLTTKPAKKPSKLTSAGWTRPSKNSGKTSSAAAAVAALGALATANGKQSGKTSEPTSANTYSQIRKDRMSSSINNGGDQQQSNGISTRPIDDGLPRPSRHNSEPLTAANTGTSYYTATTQQQIDQSQSQSGTPMQQGPSRYSDRPQYTQEPGSYHTPSAAQIAGTGSGKRPYLSNTNIPIAATGAVAGYALYESKQHSRRSPQPQINPYHGGGGASQGPPRPPVTPGGRPFMDGTIGGGIGMDMGYHPYHEHKGPIARLKDGLLNLISDPEDVQKMEEYTEYIGVCKYCFDPRSSPYDGPRQHHYHPRTRDSFENLRRRRSNDRIRRSTSGESLRRSGSARIDKDSRYYASEEKRRRSNDQAGMLGAGLAAAGVAAGANTLFNDRTNFDDTYSVKSGHRESSARRWRSRSSSRERRRRSSHGVTGGREEYVSGRSKNGYSELRRTKTKSRSVSRDRLGMGAAAVLGAGAASVASGRRRRESPRGQFVRRRSSGSSRDRSPGVGEILGFSSSKPRVRRSAAKDTRYDIREQRNATDPGFLGVFFAQSEPSKKSRNGSHEQRKKDRGFFSFSNGSSSGSDDGMAFGEGFSSKTSLPLRRKSSGRVRRRSSGEHIAATVAGIGATAAALAAAQRGQRISKRGSRPELGARRDVKTRHHAHPGHTHGPPGSSDDDEWVDELPSDVEDASSGAESALAFGESRLSARQSMESVGSNEGLGAWGWRWGGKDKTGKGKRRRAPTENAYNTPTPNSSYYPADTTQHAGPVYEPRGRVHQVESTIPGTPDRTTPPMQYIDPRPVSESGSMLGSIPGAFDAPPTSRPGAAPLQQPKPVTPIKPAFTQDPSVFDEDRPRIRRTQSSPSRSNVVGDAALIGGAALATAGIIASASKKPRESSNVRFGLTEEQQMREDREQRRREREENEGRRRADRTRALKEEAARAAHEEDAKRREEEVQIRREDENRRAAEARLARSRELEQQAEAERQNRDREFRAQEEAKLREEDARRRREDEDRRAAEAKEAREREAEQQAASERQRRDRQRREQEDAYNREQARLEAVRQEEDRIRRQRDDAEREREREREVRYRRDAEIEAENERRAKEEEATRRAESEGAERLRSRQEYRESQSNGEKSDTKTPTSSAWESAAAGVVAAATVGAVMAGAEHQKDRERDRTSRGSRTEPMPYTSKQVLPGEFSEGPSPPVIDDDVFDRDFFKHRRSNSEKSRAAQTTQNAADRVVSDMDAYYQAPYQSQAEFFRPKELDQPSEGKTKVADPHGDNQVQVYHAPEDEIRSHLNYARRDGSTGKSKHAPYGVPQLNVIAPTPPPSEGGSVRGKGSAPPSPLQSSQTMDNVEERPASDRPGSRSERSRSISWGEDKTHIYEAQTPESFEDRDGRDSYDFPRSAPVDASSRVSADENAMEISPDMKKDNPSVKADAFPAYDERTADEMPREAFYQQPIYGSATEFQIPGLHNNGSASITSSPGQSRHPDVSSSEQRMPHIPGGFDDDLYEDPADVAVQGVIAEPGELAPEPKLSKKEQKKRDKAAKRVSTIVSEPVTPITEDTPVIPTEEAVLPAEEPAWEPQLSKKEQKKREKAAKRASTIDSEPVTPVTEEEPIMPVEEPAWGPPLSKKEQKKRDKAAKRGSTIDSEPLTPVTEDEPAAPTDEFVVPAEEPAWEPPLSKKEQKKRDKAAKRAYDINDEPKTPVADEVALSIDMPSETPAADTIDRIPEDDGHQRRDTTAKRTAVDIAGTQASEPVSLYRDEQPFEPSVVEPESVKLGKKDRKKASKEADKNGISDVTTALMTADGIAALTAAVAGDKGDDSSSIASSKKRKGKKKLGETDRDPRDIEPTDRPTTDTDPSATGINHGKDEWSSAQTGFASPEKQWPEVVDPFQYQIKDDSASEPWSETTDSKKKKKKDKKNRESGRFNEPVASSPLRSEWNYDDYIGAPAEDIIRTEEPASYAEGDEQKDDQTRNAIPPYSTAALVDRVDYGQSSAAQANVSRENEFVSRAAQDIKRRHVSPEEAVRRSSLDHGRSRSVASEPAWEHEERRRSSKARTGSENGYQGERDHSVAASEPVDLYETVAKQAKRRSTHDDDDAASIVSSRSRRHDKDETLSSTKKDKEKKGGLFGIFSRKSADAVPSSKSTVRSEDTASGRSSTRDDEDEDGERRHRRRKHRGSEYGDDNDDTTSTVSESRRKHRRDEGEGAGPSRGDSRDNGSTTESRSRGHDDRDEHEDDNRERHRSKSYRDDDTESRAGSEGRKHRRRRTGDAEDTRAHSRDESVNSHRHHRRRRTDEGDYDSKDQSFLGTRVEDLPPLPVSLPGSPIVAAVDKDEQDNGTPVSATTNTTSTTDHDLTLDPQAKSLDEDFVKDPSIGDDSQSHHLEVDHELDLETLPALPVSKPASPEILLETPQRLGPAARPTSTTAVPLRFPFSHTRHTSEDERRSKSFSSPVNISTPVSPVSAQRKSRPTSSEIRPLYLVERNRKMEDVEDGLPSLPSSKPSSRASSIQGSEDWHSATEGPQSPERFKDLTIDTSSANQRRSSQDLLDSAETTPKASEFPQSAVQRPVRQEPQFYTWEDYARDARMHEDTDLDSLPALPSSRASPGPSHHEDDAVTSDGIKSAIATAIAIGGLVTAAHHVDGRQESGEKQPSVEEPLSASSPASFEDFPESAPQDVDADAALAPDVVPEDDTQVEAETTRAPTRKDSSKKAKKGKKGRQRPQADEVDSSVRHSDPIFTQDVSLPDKRSEQAQAMNAEQLREVASIPDGEATPASQSGISEHNQTSPVQEAEHLSPSQPKYGPGEFSETCEENEPISTTSAQDVSEIMPALAEEESAEFFNAREDLADEGGEVSLLVQDRENRLPLLADESATIADRLAPVESQDTSSNYENSLTLTDEAVPALTRKQSRKAKKTARISASGPSDTLHSTNDADSTEVTALAKSLNDKSDTYIVLPESTVAEEPDPTDKTHSESSVSNESVEVESSHTPSGFESAGVETTEQVEPLALGKRSTKPKKKQKAIATNVSGDRLQNPSTTEHAIDNAQPVSTGNAQQLADILPVLKSQEVTVASEVIETNPFLSPSVEKSHADSSGESAEVNTAGEINLAPSEYQYEKSEKKEKAVKENRFANFLVEGESSAMLGDIVKPDTTPELGEPLVQMGQDNQTGLPSLPEDGKPSSDPAHIQDESAHSLQSQFQEAAIDLRPAGTETTKPSDSVDDEAKADGDVWTASTAVSHTDSSIPREFENLEIAPNPADQLTPNDDDSWDTSTTVSRKKNKKDKRASKKQSQDITPTEFQLPKEEAAVLLHDEASATTETSTDNNPPVTTTDQSGDPDPLPADVISEDTVAATQLAPVDNVQDNVFEQRTSSLNDDLAEATSVALPVTEDDDLVLMQEPVDHEVSIVHISEPSSQAEGTIESPVANSHDGHGFAVPSDGQSLSHGVQVVEFQSPFPSKEQHGFHLANDGLENALTNTTSDIIEATEAVELPDQRDSDSILEKGAILKTDKPADDTAGTDIRAIETDQVSLDDGKTVTETPAPDSKDIFQNHSLQENSWATTTKKSKKGKKGKKAMGLTALDPPESKTPSDDTESLNPLQDVQQVPSSPRSSDIVESISVTAPDASVMQGSRSTSGLAGQDPDEGHSAMPIEVQQELLPNTAASATIHKSESLSIGYNTVSDSNVDLEFPAGDPAGPSRDQDPWDEWPTKKKSKKSRKGRKDESVVQEHLGELASKSDLQLTDTAVPDTLVPDIAASDTPEPNTTVPGTSVLDTPVPGTQVLDTPAPDVLPYDTPMREPEVAPFNDNLTQSSGALVEPDAQDLLEPLQRPTVSQIANGSDSFAPADKKKKGKKAKKRLASLDVESMAQSGLEQKIANDPENSADFATPGDDPYSAALGSGMDNSEFDKNKKDKESPRTEVLFEPEKDFDHQAEGSTDHGPATQTSYFEATPLYGLTLTGEDGDKTLEIATDESKPPEETASMTDFQGFAPAGKKKKDKKGKKKQADSAVVPGTEIVAEDVGEPIESQPLAVAETVPVNVVGDEFASNSTYEDVNDGSKRSEDTISGDHSENYAVVGKKKKGKKGKQQQALTEPGLESQPQIQPRLEIQPAAVARDDVDDEAVSTIDKHGQIDEHDQTGHHNQTDEHNQSDEHSQSDEHYQIDQHKQVIEHNQINEHNRFGEHDRLDEHSLSDEHNKNDEHRQVDDHNQIDEQNKIDEDKKSDDLAIVEQAQDSITSAGQHHGGEQKAFMAVVGTLMSTEETTAITNDSSNHKWHDDSGTHSPSQLIPSAAGTSIDHERATHNTAESTNSTIDSSTAIDPEIPVDLNQNNASALLQHASTDPLSTQGSDVLSVSIQPDEHIHVNREASLAETQTTLDGGKEAEISVSSSSPFADTATDTLAQDVDHVMQTSTPIKANKKKGKKVRKSKVDRESNDAESSEAHNSSEQQSKSSLGDVVSALMTTDGILAVATSEESHGPRTKTLNDKDLARAEGRVMAEDASATSSQINTNAQETFEELVNVSTSEKDPANYSTAGFHTEERPVSDDVPIAVNAKNLEAEQEQPLGHAQSDLVNPSTVAAAGDLELSVILPDTSEDVSPVDYGTPDRYTSKDDLVENDQQAKLDTMHARESPAQIQEKTPVATEEVQDDTTFTSVPARKSKKGKKIKKSFDSWATSAETPVNTHERGMQPISGSVLFQEPMPMNLTPQGLEQSKPHPESSLQDKTSDDIKLLENSSSEANHDTYRALVEDYYPPTVTSAIAASHLGVDEQPDQISADLTVLKAIETEPPSKSSSIVLPQLSESRPSTPAVTVANSSASNEQPITRKSYIPLANLDVGHKANIVTETPDAEELSSNKTDNGNDADELRAVLTSNDVKHSGDLGSSSEKAEATGIGMAGRDMDDRGEDEMPGAGSTTVEALSTETPEGTIFEDPPQSELASIDEQATGISTPGSSKKDRKKGKKGRKSTTDAWSETQTPEASTPIDIKDIDVQIGVAASAITTAVGSELAAEASAGNDDWSGFSTKKSKKEKRKGKKSGSSTPAFEQRETFQDQPQILLTEDETVPHLDGAEADMTDKDVRYRQRSHTTGVPVQSTETATTSLASGETGSRYDPEHERAVQHEEERGKLLPEQALPDMNIAEINEVQVAEDRYKHDSSSNAGTIVGATLPSYLDDGATVLQLEPTHWAEELDDGGGLTSEEPLLLTTQDQGEDDGEPPVIQTHDIEFAATLAAGLADSGFDPNLVIKDAEFHRRYSPPQGVAEADPEEVFSLPLKKNKKGKKAKRLSVEPEPQESAQPSNAAAVLISTPNTATNDFEDVLTRGLSESGFDPTFLQQVSTGGVDLHQEKQYSDLDEQTYVSKRKKAKKGRRVNTGFAESTIPTRDQSDDRNGAVAGDEAVRTMTHESDEQARPSDIAQSESWNQVTNDAKSTEETISMRPSQQDSSESPSIDDFGGEKNATESVDMTAVAGERDMDVDEMDEAYRAYKKREKRNKKKQKAVELEAESTQAQGSAAADVAHVRDADRSSTTEVIQNVVETEVDASVPAYQIHDGGEDSTLPTGAAQSKVQSVFPGLQRVKNKKSGRAAPSDKLEQYTDSPQESSRDQQRRSPPEIGDVASSGLSNTGAASASDSIAYDVEHVTADRNSDSATAEPSTVRSSPVARETGAQDPTSWSFDGIEKEYRAMDDGHQYSLSGQAQGQSTRSSSKVIHPAISQESLHRRRSQEPLRISTPTEADWDLQVSKSRSRDESTSVKSRGRQTSGEADDTPLEPTTKNRTSYLFQSPPQLGEISEAVDASLTPNAEGVRRGHPREPSIDSVTRGLSDHPEAPKDPTFGVDIDHARSSPSPAAIPSPRSLQTIAEEQHGQKRSMHGSDEAGPSTKAMDRTRTPQSIRRLRNDEESHSPSPPVSFDGAKNSGAVQIRSADYPLTTDDLIKRLSWPIVDEDTGTVNIDRPLARPLFNRPVASDHRSPSVLSNRSTASGAHFKSPEDLRSYSRASNRSSTPTLRRIDRSLSGDLRAASRRGDSGSAIGSTVTIPFEAPPTPPPNEEDVIVRSAIPDVAMADDVFVSPFHETGVYLANILLQQGYGDAQRSHVSPTRPPSVRKRQSMHIVDLESRLDQLVAENQALQEARRSHESSSSQHDADGQVLRETLETRELQLQEKDAEINQIRAVLQPMQDEIAHLTEINVGLTLSNKNLVDDANGRYATLQAEHAEAHEKWQSTTREIEAMRMEHGRLTTSMKDVVELEIANALADKNAEILRLREQLDVATERIRAMQVQIQTSRSSDILTIRDEDYFDGACQKLCQHVQQWVLRFSKLSDNRVCRLSTELNDDKIEQRLDNAILDGSDVDRLLSDRVRRRDVFMSVVMTMAWEYVFTRYLFGMDREQRQKLKALEKILAEVGPPRAIAQWRATTLTLLCKRPEFGKQCQLDTEAVAHEIFAVLSTLLPPPSSAEQQLLVSLQKVMAIAVDLSIEMRTQRAEFIMLPPLQPEYDANGDLIRKVHFNASLMNERSGVFGSNEELEQGRAVVKIVLFPLVVKKGDESGEGEEEIVVCPAQVLVHHDGAKGKKVVRVVSGAMDIDDPRKSRQSLISAAGTSLGF
nr:reticulocyte-binding protein 2 like a [Quercus suber]